MVPAGNGSDDGNPAGGLALPVAEHELVVAVDFVRVHAGHREPGGLRGGGRAAGGRAGGGRGSRWRAAAPGGTDQRRGREDRGADPMSAHSWLFRSLPELPRAFFPPDFTTGEVGSKADSRVAPVDWRAMVASES